MLNKQALHTLLDLDLPRDTEVLLIYSEQSTERLGYVCRFIFNHALRLEYKLTSNWEEFKNSAGWRINYSCRELPGVVQLLPQGLLWEKGTGEAKPAPLFRDEMVYFFPLPENKIISYDVFSAVFYFISRYEEWQSFEADAHGRFEAKASLLYTCKFHLKPVVDKWVQELGAALEQFYPGLKLPEKKFRVISTIDVDNLYAYRAKGLVRMLGASVKDILKADFKNLGERFRVLSGKKKDPFDIYTEVSDFCFEKKIPLIYFFLFRTGTAHDRTVDPKSPAYHPVFKILKENHALIGLHPSYHSSDHKDLLTDEKNRLSRALGEEITFSRQHYLRFNIRTTPHLLREQGFAADFSMGFASASGFRAGTTQPFYYYDFNAEKMLPLLFIPFCTMDGVYTVYEGTPPEAAYAEMLAIAKEIKKVNGLFISVFHERTFSDHLYKGFGSLYKKLHSELKEG